MRSVVNVIHNITNVLAEDMKPGDGDNQIAFEEVTLIVSMSKVEDMANETTKETKQGSVTFGIITELLGSSTPRCLESQVNIPQWCSN